MKESNETEFPTILYFVEYDTGKILTGTYIKKFRQNGSLITSRKTFEIKDGNFTEIALSRLDKTCLNPKMHLGGTDSKNYVFGYKEDKFSGYQSKEYAYLVFSKLEYAKEINKSLVLPKLIESKLVQADKAKDAFSIFLTELNDLENLLKEM